jgi:uncharacterized protein (TIGR02118 family)
MITGPVGLSEIQHGVRQMLKVISLLKKNEDIPFAEFRNWALQGHPALGKKLPGIRQYRMSVLLEENPDLPYDAVSEFWFDDNEARLAAFATPEGKAAAEDAASQCSSRVHLLTEEKVIIGESEKWLIIREYSYSFYEKR